MRTIRAIFQAGHLTPLERLDLPENTHLTVSLLDCVELPADGISRAALAGGAFDFIEDPREGIYSASDGEAV